MSQEQGNQDSTAVTVGSSYGLVYINAGNDTNGNPRRGWIVGYGTDEPFFVDEGYRGPHALFPHGIPPHEGRYLPALAVTPREYRDWLKRKPTRTAEEVS